MREKVEWMDGWLVGWMRENLLGVSSFTASLRAQKLNFVIRNRFGDAVEEGYISP